MFDFWSAGILSPLSFRKFSVVNIIESAWFILSTRSRSFLSFSAFCSASAFMRFISSCVKPDEASMRIACSLPVALSLALTLRMPFASMSKVTSICGTPRRAGAMPSRLNWPMLLFCAAIGRSPCNTCIVTAVWLSTAVENTSLFLHGMVVLASISFVITPPIVSIPRVSGVTSSSTMSPTPLSLLRIAPWMAAPTATTSSGFTPFEGSLPK